MKLSDSKHLEILGGGDAEPLIHIQFLGEMTVPSTDILFPILDRSRFSEFITALVDAYVIEDKEPNQMVITGERAVKSAFRDLMTEREKAFMDIAWDTSK